MGSMMLNVTDAMTASSTGVTELSIMGIPTYITPDEVADIILDRYKKRFIDM